MKTVTNEIKNDAIYTATCETWDFEYVDIVKEIVDIVDDYNDVSEILQAIGDHVIWASQEWTIIKHFCTPVDADFYGAMENFTDEVLYACNLIAREINDDDDGEEA